MPNKYNKYQHKKVVVCNFLGVFDGSQSDVLVLGYDAVKTSDAIISHPRFTTPTVAVQNSTNNCLLVKA